MAKKYGKIDLSTDELYDYIGSIVVYVNKLTLQPYNVFDINIKSITYVNQFGSLNKLSLQPILNLKFVSMSFEKYVIDSCVEYFTLYFTSEEEATYFKLKFCS